MIYIPYRGKEDCFRLTTGLQKIHCEIRVSSSAQHSEQHPHKMDRHDTLGPGPLIPRGNELAKAMACALANTATEGKPDPTPIAPYRTLTSITS